MNNKKNNSDCSCNTGCCGSTQDKKVKKRRIVIDFLFLDLIEAILKEVYGGNKVSDTNVQEYNIPQNLRNYYAAIKNKK